MIEWLVPAGDVTAVEIKDIDLPQEMRSAMAKQAESERERRAKVIHAQGEVQASEMLAQAARTLSQETPTVAAALKEEIRVP